MWSAILLQCKEADSSIYLNFLDYNSTFTFEEVLFGNFYSTYYDSVQHYINTQWCNKLF
jgi:hypothetical protein